MITVKEDTTLVGISELRNSPERIFKEMGKRAVVIERHRKPVAVMIDYKRYERQEKLLDWAEDYILGMIALERDKGSKKSDFIDIEKW